GMVLSGQNKVYDVVIYGGTSAGISSAIQSSRMGKSVVLIEPTDRIGGLTTGGLGATDIGNKNAIGGISREFYHNIKRYYDDPSNWIYESREEYFARYKGRNAEGDTTMWTFEPSAALSVYQKMIADEDIDLLYNEKLNREDGVELWAGNITSIEMESGKVFAGRMFIDATYEGDLMAAAGVSYTVGRESNDQYDENLNGVQANRVSKSLTGRIS